ncbi:DUF2026 family protein [Undibacterium sp. TS12]|uniref:DUF2026 family protein n=1 Tax=Undibacterium sp. TS12 TaxID=2908202 RepID=UPI001F4CC1D6|nr:DUF2026 family protein [Undibacterium sp. TS12]MCH8618132.1 DUF2026 domain-containing protein [Undibacterium sp. TS12]
MIRQPLLPLPDYQRIYQVIYSALESSKIAVTHRSCIFFAVAGASILREHYHLSATISVGSMALMVDEQQSNVVVYGRSENGYFVSDEKAFHAWVECDGWLIDFMAPIMGVALRKDGIDWSISPRMLQKHLDDSKSSLGEIRHLGEFIVGHNETLAESLIDNQSSRFFQLLNTCVTLYSKPQEQSEALAHSYSPVTKLMRDAPSIDGIW